MEDIIDFVIKSSLKFSVVNFLSKLDPEIKNYLYTNFQVGVTSKYHKVNFDQIQDNFYKDKVLVFVDKTNNPIAVYPLQSNIYSVIGGVKPLNISIEQYIDELKKSYGSVYYVEKAKKEPAKQQEVVKDNTLDKERYQNFINTRIPFLKEKLKKAFEDFDEKVKVLKLQAENGDLFGKSDISLLLDDSIDDISDVSNFMYQLTNSDPKNMPSTLFNEIDSFIHRPEI